jgi:hypothetical protein
MKRAAIGVRMHSGWGALVAVTNRSGTVEIIERRRIAVATPGMPGAVQPYHFAKDLELPKAEKFLTQSFEASKHLAAAALQDVIDELRSRQYRVEGSAMLLAAGRPLPPLPRILAAHPLIHTAEGEFFREVFSKSCQSLGLSVTGFQVRELEKCAQATFGKAATRIGQQISAMGRSLGPPWTQDQKTAALAALIVLANRKS